MACRRLGSALLGVALAVVACTSPGEDAAPSPTPAPSPPAESPAAGIRVAFVLPAAASVDDEQRTQLAGDLQSIGALRDDGISEVRTVEPDGPEFVRDLAALLADRGTDLICVLGPEAQRAAAPLAVRHPHLRFCAVPAGTSEAPENLVAVEVRFEELGHVVGLAAAATAGDGPVASILGSDRAGVTQLRDGIRAGVDGLQLLESAPSDEEGALEAVDAAVDADAAVVIVDLGVGAAAAIDRAVAADMVVIAHEAVLDQTDVADATVLSWRLRWDVALRPVVASMLDSGETVPSSVGIAEGMIVVAVGDALSGPATAVVEEAVAELRRGARDPLESPLPQGASPEREEHEGEDA
jgi:basic membrane lipoprotein Med (substrate-binding protein (PBP1-ABC) superfamily)